MRNTVGERIKALREECGYTQVKLAELLNVSDKAVSKWETNNSYPDIPVLIDLSNVLKTSIDYILKGEELVVDLDMMDKDKRLIYLISKDNLDKFKSYFEEYINGFSLYKNGLVDKLLPKINEAKAYKIFDYMFHNIKTYLANNNVKLEEKLSNDSIIAYYKLAIDQDNEDALKLTNIRQYAPNEKIAENVRWSSIYTNVISYDDLEYLFKKKDESPKCYEYMTNPDYTSNYSSKRIDLAFIEEDMMKLALKYDRFLVDRHLEAFREESKNTRSYYKGDVRYNTVKEDTSIIRLVYFTDNFIKYLIVTEPDEVVDKFISYNTLAYNNNINCTYSYANGSMFYNLYNPNATERQKVRIKSNDNLSEIEKKKKTEELTNIINFNHLDEIFNLDISDANYNYLERFVNKNYIDEFEEICRNKDNTKILFKYVVDHKLNYSKNKLIENDLDTVEYELCKKYYNDNKISYVTKEDCKYDIIYQTFKTQKENWLNNKKAILENAKLSLKLQEATCEITKDYINKLIKDDNIELAVIKLCSKLHALLADYYKDEESTFEELLTKYCSNLTDEDGDYLPIVRKLHALRKARNNYGHYQTEEVKFSANDLQDCILFIFSMEGDNN